MGARVAVVCNQPETTRYEAMGEAVAIISVLECVNAVTDALHELGFDTVLIKVLPPVENIRKKLTALKIDLIFNLFEGFEESPETEALLPEIADELGIPYTGCTGPTLRLGLDKARAKAMMKAAGIRTSDFQVLTPATLGEFHLKYPCIVKPRAEDASHGLTEASVVYDDIALRKQVELMCAVYKKEALVEEFIGGREFNATGMGNANPVVLPISEIQYNLPENLPKLLTFAAKWEEDSPYFKGTIPVCPAPITANQRRQIVQIVLKTYKLFNCRGFARVDLRMDDKGNVYVIELNPNPDITPGNGTARHAATLGLTYTEFIGRIVQLAFESTNAYYPTNALQGQTDRDDDTARYARVPAP